MHITHPQAPYQGIAPENVFFVFSERQVQMGTGYVIHFFQREMYPERPQHIFMQIDAQPSARALLYGALLARSEQMKALHPEMPTRVYAQVAPENESLMRFYTSCGFQNDDGEDLYRFPVPQGGGRAPMSMEFASVPLADPAQRDAFLARMNQYRIQPITPDYLTLWQQQPHFMALGFYRGGMPVSEVLITGAGENATLLMMYTRPEYRHQGMGLQLLGSAGVFLRQQGVAQLYTHIFRRNIPQMNLMRRLNGVCVRTVTALPGVNLDGCQA